MQAAPAAAGSVSTVTTFDDGWYRSVTDFARHTGWLNGIMSMLTVALIVVLALMVGYAAWRGWRAADRVALAASAWAGCGTVVSIGLGLGLKQVFHETRPCLALPGVTTVQACPGPADYSFPSDHTTVAVALAAGLWLINRRLGLVGAAIALVEGFSRVYLGQHYPHDVLAAAVLSSVVVLGGWPLVRRPLMRLVNLVPGLGAGVPQGPRGTQPEGVAEATHGHNARAHRSAAQEQEADPALPATPTTPTRNATSAHSLSAASATPTPPTDSPATASPAAGTADPASAAPSPSPASSASPSAESAS